ncbi:hypothetical protein PUMCH_002803 [Australozyma saopauloensis]|uniref:PH domain-containing protein n=1 Tax=Australozyma saopauloensis TaxID=291208 RepID=A0AAX4HAT0_9ASCO|nr:hypothetical protein PUMCH_002803 [[Candida] saopauloensis]
MNSATHPEAASGLPLKLLREDMWSEKPPILSQKMDQQHDRSGFAASHVDLPAEEDFLATILSNTKLTRSISLLSHGLRSITDISFDSGSLPRPASPSTLLLVSPVLLDLPCSPKQQLRAEQPFPQSFLLDAKTFPRQDSFLLFMEPAPVNPPQYNVLPPGGCPRFHVYDKLAGQESLPNYKPAAYKLGICARKLEWYSPYEAAATRSWKNFLVELNSTQLNFYLIPSHLEQVLLDARSSISEELSPSGEYPEHLESLFTTNADKAFYSVCDKLNVLPSCEWLNGSRSLSVVLLSRLNAPNNKRLVRSYSLQHAKLGLASDYTKRANVLRLRLENEQLLILFATAKDMIQWNLAVLVGRDLALDLTDRDLPRYRTVPRRRRNNIDRNTPFFNDMMNRRTRAQSDPNASLSLRGRFFRLKGKFNSSANSSASASSRDVLSAPTPRTRESRLYTTSNIALAQVDTPPRSMTSTPSSVLTTGQEDDMDEDVLNLSDVHNSDDEDDLEAYMDILAQCNENNTQMGMSLLQTTRIEDEKWFPVKQIDSEKRQLRDSLKCIRPLTFGDPWLNKTLVKPANMSPLTHAYLRESYFASELNLFGRSRSSSTVSVFSSSDKKRQSLISKESFLNLPDAALSRIPHHNLREYQVGSHSLTPKYI